MFDVAPQELLLLGAVAVAVIPPKDLPRAMRFAGQWIGKARGMARHFRSGLDEMIRQAELEDIERKWREENERIMREHPLRDVIDHQAEGAAGDPVEPPAKLAALPRPDQEAVLTSESLADEAVMKPTSSAAHPASAEERQDKGPELPLGLPPQQ